MPVTIHVEGNEVTFNTPGEARAASRRYKRMARDLQGGSDETPEVTMKVHELRARAKQLDDWARTEEDRAPAEPKTEPAPEPAPADHARRGARKALRETGIRTGKATAARAASARRRGSRAVRRYERAGGAQLASGGGDFVVFLAGSIIALVLLEDVLSPRGAVGFGKATEVGTSLVHRLIAPVPLVTAP